MPAASDRGRAKRLRGKGAGMFRSPFACANFLGPPQGEVRGTPPGLSSRRTPRRGIFVRRNPVLDRADSYVPATGVNILRQPQVRRSRIPLMYADFSTPTNEYRPTSQHLHGGGRGFVPPTPLRKYAVLQVKRGESVVVTGFAGGFVPQPALQRGRSVTSSMLLPWCLISCLRSGLEPGACSESGGSSGGADMPGLPPRGPRESSRRQYSAYF